MEARIDCFIPYVDEVQGKTLSHMFEQEHLVGDVVYLLDDERPEGAHFIPLHKAMATKAVVSMAQTAERDYLLLCTSDAQIKLGYRALERMVSVADATKAVLVYSDRLKTSQQDNGSTSQLAPTIDYQLGALRDDFDFGSLVLLRRSALREFAASHPETLTFAGFYQLRLFLSRKGHIEHIPEILYTEVETDNRTSGQKQFDYVDPRNRSIQIEMERACTEHLKQLGALVKPTTLRLINPAEGEFPVEASVIIPVRNRERTIADAIRSALNQETDFPFNVIVVNNHSTDGTHEAILDVERTKGQMVEKQVVELIPEREDLGIGGCWDLAVRHPKCGRFAIQLDSDDLYSSPHVLQTIVDTFHRERCAMLIGSYELCDFSLRPLPPGLIDHKEWTDENGMNNALRINGLGAPRCFYTPVIREIGFPNVSYGEDYAVGLAISRTYRLGRIYKSLYLCRRWEGNSDAALSPEKVNHNNTYKDFIRTVELSERQKIKG